MTTIGKLFAMSLLSVGSLLVTTPEMLIAATNSGALGMVTASGTLGGVTTPGAVGTGPTSGALGGAITSGALGAVPTSGAPGAVPTSGALRGATSSGALGTGPMSGALGAVPASATAATAPTPSAPGAATVAANTSSLNVVPVITSVSVVGSNLVASGIAYVTVKGQTTLDSFTAPVTLQPMAVAGDPTNCPVLNLQLGAIGLNLLGLVVDTSAICVTITAYPDGGLLGQLLCRVATLLQVGTPLGSVSNGLTTTELNNLFLGITSLLNGALANLSHALVSSLTPGLGGPCSTLNLELGPLKLNLLGLDVLLSNCATGSLTVTITADRNGSLGNSLCGLLGGNQIPLGTGLTGLLDQLLALPAQ